MKKLLLLAVAALMLVSCTVQSPFTASEEYFQALGEEGTIVVTAEVERVKDGPFSSLLASVDDSILSRSQRLSLSLEWTGSGWLMSGAAEGNFPRSLVNTALNWSRDFQKDEEVYRAKDGSMEATVPRNGLLLFSQTDVLALKERTWANRVIRIDSSTARTMAAADAAVYSVKPVSIPPLFIELPQSVVDKTEAFLLLLDGADGSAYISGWMKMDSQQSAKTLLTLFRNELVKAVRSRGEKLDTKLLSTYFQAAGDTVLLDFPLEVFTKDGGNAAL